MIDRIDTALTGFDEAVLERWGLKPTAKDTLYRAKERGAITPQEISEMVSTALAKDRQKLAQVLHELKQTLQNLNISVTFNIVHTHTTLVQPTAITPATVAQKPQPEAKEQTVLPLVTTKGPQYAGQDHESPFLNAKFLGEQGLVPNALGILLAAKAKGHISPQQIGTLIPAEISQDNAKLRTIMRRITQLLGAINVKIVIGEVHYKKPESRSPETSYSRRPEPPSSNRGRLPVLFNSTGLSEATSEDPSKEALLEIEKGEETEAEGEEGEHADPNGEFIPKFIFDREDGVTNPYYRAVKNHKFLRHQDLMELSRRWHMYGDYEARNTIVVHNLRLSMKIAAHYMGKGLDYDDLVQEGNIGLMVAAERFDFEMGFRFTTYATWWVRQKIVRAIQNFKAIIRIPVHAQEAWNKILKITCELGMELQREPTLEEVAARADVDVGVVRKILRRLNLPVVSLEELAYGASSKDSDVTIGETIRCNHFPFATTALEAKEDLEIASRNIRTLLAVINALPISDRYKTVFKMYWGLEGHSEDHIYESIRPAMGGVTRSRIQQMEDRVWKELAKHGIAMTREKLDEELKRVHDLENIVCAEADLSTPTEALILDEVSIIFQDDAEKSGGEVVPGVTITPKRPQAKLAEVKPGISTPQDIIRVVGDVYGKTQETILGESRPNEVVWVRWVCTYIMREELKSSFVGIGHALHYADHTSAMHGHQSIKQAIERDPALADEIEKIIALCGFREEKIIDPEEVAGATESAAKAASPIVDQVLTLTSQVFDVEKSSLLQKFVRSIDPAVARAKSARSTAMYILRTDFNISCEEVARLFGFSHYTNVSDISRTTAEQLKVDVDLQAKLTLIRSRYSLQVYGGNWEEIKRCQNSLFPKQVEEMRDIVDRAVRSFKEKVRRLHAKIESLDMPDRHKEILKLRCSGDLTKEIPAYEALGQMHDHITRQRVRQIIGTALEKLAPLLDESDIHPDVFTEEFERVRFLVELQNL